VISSFLISSSHRILGTDFMLAPLMILPQVCLIIIISLSVGANRMTEERSLD
jgi:hypothetical protein